MKLNRFLSTVLIAAVPALSLGVHAADVDKAPSTDQQTQTEKTAPKKVKPHSHVAEKGGATQAAPEAMADTSKPAKERHNHQRDAK